jgi:ribosomal protein S18 acetylase RimI-like enzyme
MIIEATSLGPADLAAIAELEQRVVEADGGRLKLEWPALRHRNGDVVQDLLWWEDGRLLGFAGIYGDREEPEIAGMVDPAARRRGIGTALVTRADELARRHGAREVLLVVARTTGAGAAFAAGLGGVHDHSEHSLVLRSAPDTRRRAGSVSLREAGPEDNELTLALLAAGFGRGRAPSLELAPGERRLVIEHEGEPVGTMRVDLDPAAGDQSSAGIYGFTVVPERRGRGIGGEALRQVCAGLIDGEVAEVHLEVDVANESALGLYTSLGFVLRATEDYYTLPPVGRVGRRSTRAQGGGGPER